MRRFALITAVAGVMLAVPAYAQDRELDGAPPPLQIPNPATPKPLTPTPKPIAPRATTPTPATSTNTTEQQRLVQQAAAQKAEQARLTALAADLAQQKARLDARAVELAAEEKRLTRLREDQDADYARQLAEFDKQRNAGAAPVTASLPAAPRTFDPAPPVATNTFRISYDDARRACTRAGMSDAIEHDFYSARYAAAPRFFERQRELRGRMRMDDREGYLTVDTVCQLDANGTVLRFEVLR